MTSTTYKRHRMRCGITKCRKRFTLRRHPSEYIRVIKCPACGDSTLVRHVEDERQRELAKRKRTGNHCFCNAYLFPHARGSLRACMHHPLADVELTPQEELDYEAIMSTARSSY